MEHSYFILHDSTQLHPVADFRTMQEATVFLLRKYTMYGTKPFMNYTLAQYLDGYPINHLSSDQLLLWLLNGGRQ